MSLPLWEECAWNDLNRDTHTVPTDSSVEDNELPFSIDSEINSRVFLHLGAGYKIPCNACIVGQNEQLDDRSEDNAAIFALFGPTVEAELFSLSPIQTGESVVTSGGSLPFEWLVHAVGPRYDARYLTASDHALFSAYKSALLLAAEKQASDLVISCVYSHRKKYPRFEAAHVALRAVRKFLQNSVGGVFRRLMFCVPTQEDFEIYASLMTAYFPRSAAEQEGQRTLLPQDLGDVWGELVITERVLKVSAGPQPLPKQSRETYRRSNHVSEDGAGEGGDSLDSHGKRSPKTGGCVCMCMYEYVCMYVCMCVYMHEGCPPPWCVVIAACLRMVYVWCLHPSLLTGCVLYRGAQCGSGGPGTCLHDGSEWRQGRGAQDARREGPGQDGPRAAHGAALPGHGEFSLVHPCSTHDLTSPVYNIQVEDLEDEDVASALDKLLQLDFVRCAGQDRKGRSVVVIVASSLQLALARCTEDDTLLLCFMRVMEDMRCRPYVLLYCAGGQRSVGQAANDAMVAEDREQRLTQQIFDLFAARYEENMQRLYILHASFLFRMYLYFALPF
ncbi:hypothetical protein EON65_35630, partial [archaeon]